MASTRVYLIVLLFCLVSSISGNRHIRRTEPSQDRTGTNENGKRIGITIADICNAVSEESPIESWSRNKRQKVCETIQHARAEIGTASPQPLADEDLQPCVTAEKDQLTQLEAVQEKCASISQQSSEQMGGKNIAEQPSAQEGCNNIPPPPEKSSAPQQESSVIDTCTLSQTEIDSCVLRFPQAIGQTSEAHFLNEWKNRLSNPQKGAILTHWATDAVWIFSIPAKYFAMLKRHGRTKESNTYYHNAMNEYSSRLQTALEGALKDVEFRGLDLLISSKARADPLIWPLFVDIIGQFRKMTISHGGDRLSSIGYYKWNPSVAPGARVECEHREELQRLDPKETKGAEGTNGSKATEKANGPEGTLCRLSIYWDGKPDQLVLRQFEMDGKNPERKKAKSVVISIARGAQMKIEQNGLGKAEKGVPRYGPFTATANEAILPGQPEKSANS